MSEAGLPLEIERKFLIALPDAALLGEKSVKRLAIAQVYLRAVTSGAGRRIRRARCGDETRYYYTEKTRVTAVTRIEREHEITAAEFEALLSERDEALRTIEKTRYLVPFEGHTLGYFPTEAEAVRRAVFLPKGRYTVREWERDGEFSTFDPSTNKHYDFNN